MVSANAAAADDSAAFATAVTGFEVLELTGAAGNDTVDLAALGNFSKVSAAAGTNTLTLNNFVNGGTLSMTGDGTAYGVNVKDAATGAADVVNLVLRKAGALTAGTVTAANVESVTIAANDTTADVVAGTNPHTLTLVATKATSLTVTGNAKLTLTNTGNTALTSIDASAMTGALIVTTAGTVAETVKGGSGADQLTALTGTVADTLIGNDGKDTLTSNAGLTTLTGGAGADTFVVQTPSANVNMYTTITDASAGDTIKLATTGVDTFAKTKLSLGDTAVFQDYANLAALSSTAVADHAASWFQFGGNTYIVQDRSADTSFVNGTDIIVKLTGLVDLSNASLNNGAVTTLLLA
jgi:S-layer protein